jgi:GT2 family glycosyltransferase
MSAPVALFVVHWNQPTECIATVNALCAQDIPLQVTIIDNNSEAAAVENLKSRIGSETKLVRLNANMGWGGALNMVLKPWLESGENRYCFISAHDAVPEPGCLQLLLEAAEGDARIGIACPQYREPFVGRFSSARGVFPENVPTLSTGIAQVVDVPHGTLMLCRRECLQQIGLFDERYFAYGDEHELGLRARRHRWKVVMVWGAIVTNPATWTESPLRSYLFARNSLLLVRDYAGRWQALVRAILILLNTFRLMFQSSGKAFAFSARARFRAVSDYFRGAFGRPGFAG